MKITSFGKTFLLPSSTDRGSIRMAFRTYLAARRRWPNGRLRIRGKWLHYMIPAGINPPGSEMTGIMMTF